MNKQEFLSRLGKELSGLPQRDIEECLVFYSELIEDRIEEGLSEEEAVLAVGSIEEIASQTLANIPLSKIAKERIKPKRRLKAWEITLLIIGSPLWFSLLVAAAAMLISIYAVIWCAIISLWAVFASLACCAIAGVAAGIIIAIKSNALSGIAIIGAAIICAGISIIMFYGCKAATKGVLKITVKTALSIKKCFIKKGEAQ